MAHTTTDETPQNKAIQALSELLAGPEQPPTRDFGQDALSLIEGLIGPKGVAGLKTAATEIGAVSTEVGRQTQKATKKATEEFGLLGGLLTAADPMAALQRTIGVGISRADAAKGTTFTPPTDVGPTASITDPAQIGATDEIVKIKKETAADQVRAAFEAGTPLNFVEQQVLQKGQQLDSQQQVLAAIAASPELQASRDLNLALTGQADPSRLRRAGAQFFEGARAAIGIPTRLEQLQQAQEIAAGGEIAKEQRVQAAKQQGDFFTRVLSPKPPSAEIVKLTGFVDEALTAATQLSEIFAKDPAALKEFATPGNPQGQRVKTLIAQLKAALVPARAGATLSESERKLVEGIIPGRALQLLTQHPSDTAFRINALVGSLSRTKNRVDPDPQLREDVQFLIREGFNREQIFQFMRLQGRV